MIRLLFLGLLMGFVAYRMLITNGMFYMWANLLIACLIAYWVSLEE